MENELTFLVQGAATEPYTVNFKKSDSAVRATCTCPAGVFYKRCRHMVNLIEGNPYGVLNNVEAVSQVVEMYGGTPVEQIVFNIVNYKQELSIIKSELKKAQSALSDLL
jgi:hypothetical protein